MSASPTPPLAPPASLAGTNYKHRIDQVSHSIPRLAQAVDLCVCLVPKLTIGTDGWGMIVSPRKLTIPNIRLILSKAVDGSKSLGASRPVVRQPCAFARENTASGVSIPVAHNCLKALTACWIGEVGTASS